MSELSVPEKDLLQRVQDKPELRILFFKKVKGLKWFNALDKRGYFDANNIPKPMPARQEGYITIPRWDIGEYLAKTASELTGENGSIYASRYLEIIFNATSYAKDNGFGNHHVWWQFAESVSKIPSQFITIEFLDIVDYWLDDKFDTGIVVSEIGEKWLPTLLEEQNNHARELSIKLLDILYKITFVKKKTLNGTEKLDALLRYSHYEAEKITKKVAFLAGRKLGQCAIAVFHSNLKQTLKALDNDTWSSIWHPAIENHAQNKYQHDPENILIEGYRECLRGFLKYHPDEACKYIGEMLESPFQTIQRLAIYCTTYEYLICKKYNDPIINSKFLESNFRHETWHFLNQNYSHLEKYQKDCVIKLIRDRKHYDKDNALLEGATAYEQATWLAAIKTSGKLEKQLYQEAIALAKTEPDHPDFSSYMSTRSIGQNSPYSVEELNALSICKLVGRLTTFKGGDGWEEPGIGGLAQTVKQLIKTSPSNYYTEISKFSDLKLPYVCAIIQAYNDLWNEKAKLPWDDIWAYLLEFCSIIVNAEEFWNKENSREREALVENRSSVISAIGRLLEAGVKSDEHTFHDKYNSDAESIIALILKHETGAAFNKTSDAVSIAINSSRGHCIEALINLALRSCRLRDRTNHKDHADVWEKFQPYFDAELKRSEIDEYEFSTLVTNYLPNFLYMSDGWVKNNLKIIFDQKNYLKWLCAMQGYSYVGTVYQDIYYYLNSHGDLLKALDDKNITEHVKERVVHQIVVAYINDLDSLKDDDNLIPVLIHRKDFDQLNRMVWFIWSLRKDDDVKLRSKVFELWPLLLNAVDFSSSQGRKLASTLCLWADFVDDLDEKRKKLILTIAPYAAEAHNSHHLLKSIANLSKKQPLEVVEIWFKIIEETAADYPEEAIRQILSNLIAQGDEGKRTAREIISEYLKQGVERPSIWLREIINKP